MEYKFEALAGCSLFYNMPATELDSFLSIADTQITHYNKGDILLCAGAAATRVGVVLSGKAAAQKLTKSGRSFTISQLSKGSVFADVLVLGHSQSPVTITAAASCAVLYIPFLRIFENSKIMQNLVSVVSEKYFSLDRRIDILLEKSLRSRILMFLKEQREKSGSQSFTVAVNRQQMADYLGCERSAMCRELSRMKAERLINYTKNSFELL